MSVRLLGAFFAAQSLLRSTSSSGMNLDGRRPPDRVRAREGAHQSRGSLFTALSQLRSKSGPAIPGRAFAAFAAHPASPAQREKGPLDLFLIRFAHAPRPSGRAMRVQICSRQICPTLGTNDCRGRFFVVLPDQALAPRSNFQCEMSSGYFAVPPDSVLAQVWCEAMTRRGASAVHASIGRTRRGKGE